MQCPKLLLHVLSYVPLKQLHPIKVFWVKQCVLHQMGRLCFHEEPTLSCSYKEINPFFANLRFFLDLRVT